MSELDRLTRELVKQMVGRDVDDEQDGDYQIAYHYLSKAMKLSEQSEVNQEEEVTLDLAFRKLLNVMISTLKTKTDENTNARSL